MSLFNTIDFWSTQCGENENFGFDSLIISDLNETGIDKIIIGSFSGLLRIYTVNYNVSEQSSYKASDLLLEKQLSGCIVQVIVGKLVSGSKQIHLGIVHTQRITVYSFSAFLGSTDHGDQFELKEIYEHTLEHLCYQVIIGSFGGVTERDFLCVFSLDGTLLFFEQETFIFETKLPSFLLPFPMVYVSHSDSFVTLSADWYIESYRYQDLVNTVKKKIVPNWSYNLGEAINGLKTVQHQNETFIIVLSEHNLICFNSNGSVKFTKRFQFSPLIFSVYLNECTFNVMILICSDSGTLYVFEEATLRWNSRLPILPVCMCKSNIGVNGSLVLLSDKGELNCCYLGTKPSLFVAPSLENSVSSYKNVNLKLEKLQNEIKNLEITNAESLKLTIAEKEIAVTLKISSYNKIFNQCEVVVNVLPCRPLSNVQIILDVPLPFLAVPKSTVFSTLYEKTNFNALLQVNDNKEIVPSSTTLVAVLCFVENNIPRVLRKQTNIPLKFFQISCPAIVNKKNLFRVNIQTNKPPIILSTIFQEFKDENWSSNECNDETANFCLCYNENIKCTVSLLKLEYGYEFYSDSISMLYLLVKDVIFKCENHKMGAEKENICFDCKYILKDEFTKIIDDHVLIRNEIHDLQLSLEKLNSQYRLIQRRLLVKMKDKMPSPMDAILMLHNDTYQKLMETIRIIEEKQEKLVVSSHELQSVTNLTFDLLRINSKVISFSNLEKLKNAILMTDFNSDSQGWEERTYANLIHLLRTSLRNSDKDDNRILLPSNERIVDSSKLNKLLFTAIKRVVSDGIFTQMGDRSKMVSPILEKEESNESDSNDTKLKFLKREKLLIKRHTYDEAHSTVIEHLNEVE